MTKIVIGKDKRAARISWFYKVNWIIKISSRSPISWNRNLHL